MIDNAYPVLFFEANGCAPVEIAAELAGFELAKYPMAVMAYQLLMAGGEYDVPGVGSYFVEWRKRA